VEQAGIARDNMKRLLTVDAIIEMGAGLLMVVLPSQLWKIVLGTTLSTPVELTLSRIAGVAFVALAISWWLARDDEQSHTLRGVVGGMLVFNAGVVIVLGYAGIVLRLSTILLWPFILFRLAMAVWCVIQLRHKPAQRIRGG
jgi:hypothetical protein